MSDRLEINYLAPRPTKLNAGTVNAYISPYLYFISNISNIIEYIRVWILAYPCWHPTIGSIWYLSGRINRINIPPPQQNLNKSGDMCSARREECDGATGNEIFTRVLDDKCIYWDLLHLFISMELPPRGRTGLQMVQGCAHQLESAD